MITSDQQYTITQQRIAEFRAALAEITGQSDPVPEAQESACQSVISLLTSLEREAAMWEAGIREPVPGHADPVQASVTMDELNAMDPAAYAATSRRLVATAKRAEIANIDRQIGLQLDRIADWRRHRAWLEREIAALEADATERQPQHSHAG